MAHGGHGMPAGGDMANGLGMITRGPALSQEHGPHMGRGLGEQTGNDRAARNGPMIGARELDPRYQVPGYPQDMMDMHGYRLRWLEYDRVNSREFVFDDIDGQAWG